MFYCFAIKVNFRWLTAYLAVFLIFIVVYQHGLSSFARWASDATRCRWHVYSNTYHMVYSFFHSDSSDVISHLHSPTAWMWLHRYWNSSSSRMEAAGKCQSIWVLCKVLGVGHSPLSCETRCEDKGLVPALLLVLLWQKLLIAGVPLTKAGLVLFPSRWIHWACTAQG